MLRQQIQDQNRDLLEAKGAIRKWFVQTGKELKRSCKLKQHLML